MVPVNGYEFAAVAAACVTALLIALLWAVVRLAQRDAGARLAADVELSADEEFRAVQEHNARGRAGARRQIADAAERAGRERRGEW